MWFYLFNNYDWHIIASMLLYYVIVTADAMRGMRKCPQKMTIRKKMV